MLQPRYIPLDIDFQTLSRRAPARAGDLAYKLFCTPRLSERRSADHEALASRARYHLRNSEIHHVTIPNNGTVRIYIFQPEIDRPIATVLVVHGWTSEASFMTAIAEPLRRSGFRIALFDCPAHGQSTGRQTSLIDCARATLSVAQFIQERFGYIRSVIAHSMGSLASLLAAKGGAPLPGAANFPHFVLISSPNKFSEVTRDFAQRIGLSSRAQHIYEHHLERIAHRHLSNFTATTFLLNLDARALLIHAHDDTEIPIHNAFEIAKTCPNANLVTFDHLGHRNILYAPPVIRTILNELKHETKTHAKDTVHNPQPMARQTRTSPVAPKNASPTSTRTGKPYM